MTLKMVHIQKKKKKILKQTKKRMVQRLMIVSDSSICF